MWKQCDFLVLLIGRSHFQSFGEIEAERNKTEKSAIALNKLFHTRQMKSFCVKD